MWVKPQPGMRVRDYRTRQLWPDDDKPVEIPDHDFVFAQMINHGDLVECDAPEPDPEPDAEAAAKARAPKAAPTPQAEDAV